jgi:hypothetical protein
MNLKGFHLTDVAEIQKAVTDELEKFQKRNIRQLFRICTTAQKSVYTPMELIVKKKLCAFLMCLRFSKSQP